ncbi:MAG: hypothetical protein FK733_18855 [Asgard group archaeon]|nr:hypothetical protein [Asgard group archaeon]
MNKRKLAILFILTTLFAMTILYSSKDLITNAAVEEPPVIIYTPNYSDVSAVKTISHGAEALGLGVSGNNSYVGETFTITIDVANFGTEDIYEVNVTSVESNVTALGYYSGWFDFPGDDPSGYIGYLPGPGANDTSYTITPLLAGIYTFPGSNVTYSNGTNYFYVISNPITFTVFQEPPSVVVEKSVLFESDEFINGRVKDNREFFIQINITNYYYVDINATAIDNPPGSTDDFDYNETLLSHNFTEIDSLDSGIYQYNLSAKNVGDYIIPKFNLTYYIEGDPLPYIDAQSNEIILEVYHPIYEGDDWTLKVPMLSVSKYFQWNDTTKEENGLLVNETKLEFTNETEHTILIILNVTNSGNVSAFDIEVREPVYNNWVFETDGVLDPWPLFNLTKGQSKLLNYTITTKIIGVFKIEPTEVTYSYINQETLLVETDNVLYSNIIEVKITEYVPDRDLTSEWWTTIGISLGIVALVAIPLIITFVMYGKRRRIQRGT